MIQFGFFYRLRKYCTRGRFGQDARQFENDRYMYRIALA
jgi:hypothetical protein